jgi:hypothetical protein
MRVLNCSGTGRIHNLEMRKMRIAGSAEVLKGHRFAACDNSRFTVHSLKGHDFAACDNSRFTVHSLKGHDFAACDNSRFTVHSLKGHDFSRATNAANRTRALAPEGW